MTQSSPRLELCIACAKASHSGLMDARRTIRGLGRVGRRGFVEVLVERASSGESGAMSRSITRSYRDPLEQIWFLTAQRVGLTIRRSDQHYAHSDGTRTLFLGTPETLDADDHAAQMVLHELCHASVEGEASFARPDWGLDNTTGRHRYREHACLRLQAKLADIEGLRGFLAPTTNFRAFYDQLAEDPLSGEGEDVSLAVEAFERGKHSTLRAELLRALRATRQIVDVLEPWSEALSGESRPSLYSV